MTREFTTKSPEETIALGRELASLLTPPKLMVLRGDLGAGKTTLIKGIAEGFNAASQQDVTSPTFTLIHEYRGPSATLYHIDLYRVDTQRELETLGLDDLMSESSVLLIEWEKSLRDSSASAMWRLRWNGFQRADGTLYFAHKHPPCHSERRGINRLRMIPKSRNLLFAVGPQIPHR